MIEVKPVDETSFYQVLNLTVAEPDQAHQGKGYGRAVLEAVIDLAKQHPVCDRVRADYVKGNEKMAHLLTSLGFSTFDQDEREIFTKLDLE